MHLNNDIDLEHSEKIEADNQLPTIFTETNLTLADCYEEVKEH